MKADLNKILAALQQLEQNPHSGSRPFVTPNQDPIADSSAEVTSTAKSSSSSVPIPPLKLNRKAPSLPTFNSSSEDNASEAPSVTIAPPSTLREELQQIIQQIENLYVEGPIVDGWLESYPCESIPRDDDESAFKDIARPLEYVKAARSLDQDNVICEAPRSCYRLNGVSATGQQWSYPCPMEQLPSVSVAIARYEKLLQLVDRKWDLETRLKQL